MKKVEAPPMPMLMPTAMTADPSLYRLMAWLSPSFPVGAFSYSHGLEYAVETGLVRTRENLVGWIAAVLRQGSGLSDGMLFVAAWRARDADDPMALGLVLELAAALRPTSELALESAAQGAAFVRAIRDAWPHPVLLSALPEDGDVGYAPAVAVCAHAHGLNLRAALRAFLHAFAANLISAGVRLIPLGQTDGQIALRLLEAEVEATAELAERLPLEEIGSATPMLDYCSAQHETQYTRLFRT